MLMHFNYNCKFKFKQNMENTDCDYDNINNILLYYYIRVQWQKSISRASHDVYHECRRRFHR